MCIEQQFLGNFHEVAKIGATPKMGVERQAATKEDGLTKDWFAEYAQSAGFEVIVDAIGNQFAKVVWKEGQPSVLVGSHLDSQPLGGRFDGAYGVISALHVAKFIDQEVKKGAFSPNFNLVVANWFNEEGARFTPSIMGSSVFAGLYELEDMLAVTDPKGVTVQTALEAIGYRDDKDPGGIINYAEIHIEQGRILDRESIEIGLVTESWYTQKLHVDVHGEQSHTGATAMADRKDALITASQIVLLVRKVVENFPPESLVSSVGKFDVLPNSPIVVPREVKLVVDLRSNDPQIVQKAREILLNQLTELSSKDDISIEARDFDIRPKYFLSQEGIKINQSIAESLGMSTRLMSTMAGHDAVAINSVIPTMMLFIPSKDGISHCEREFTTNEDMVNGNKFLKESLKHLLVTPMAYDQPFISKTVR